MRKETIVLGISPGTRSVGFALMCGNELLGFEIQSFKETWSRKKLRRILEAISFQIIQYDIREVAVKVPDNMPASKGFSQIIGSMNVLFEAKKIKKKYYSLTDIQKKLGIADGTQELIAEAMAQKYPALSRAHSKKHLKIYYRKLFEAVAVAQCHTKTKGSRC
jgi:Holliday junction resolvasome RuvABC endonuclease subunit